MARLALSIAVFSGEMYHVIARGNGGHGDAVWVETTIKEIIRFILYAVTSVNSWPLIKGSIAQDETN